METEEAAAAAAAEIPEAAAASATAASPMEDDEPVIFQVVLKGGSPWGFSLKGGAEHHCPLVIAKLEPGGKAHQSVLLQCGDQVLAVNDVQCNSHTEAIQLVKSAFNTLQLSVIRGSPGDYKQGVKHADYYQSQEVLPEPTKTAPTGGVGGVVTRRLKKRDSTNSPRPKSWHNAEASQHWKEREFNQQQHPPPIAMMHQQVPRPMPQSYSVFPGQPRLDTAPSMDSLTMQNSGGDMYPSKNLRGGPNTQSMMSLHHSEKLEFAPGYMKRSITEFGSTQDMNYYTKNREFAQSYYGNKRAPFMSMNPEFRRVDLSPAETYPKVAVATQLQSAQQRAFIGRVPDTKEMTPHDQPVQTFTSSRVVSYSTVQMPQRQYASTAESQNQFNGNHGNTNSYHPGYSLPQTYNPTQTMSSHGSEQISPTPSEKKTPPPLPKRGESYNKTLQISEHMKSSSWPATTESSDTYENEAPVSVISPTNLPPVKLSPSQEYPPRKSSSNSSSSVGSIPMENNYVQGDELRGSLKSPSQGVYTAQPFYIDDSNNSNTDMDSWFNDSAEQKDLQDHNQRYNYSKEQNPPSPPTRDIDPQRSSGNVVRRERRPTADSLTGAYQTYLEEMLEQEDQLNIVDPSDVFMPSSTVNSVDPLSQTAPPSFGSQQQGHAPLRRIAAEDVTSNPTNRWTKEQNKKNNLIGQMEQERSWQSPADFKKSVVIDPKQEGQQQRVDIPIEQKEEEWQRLVKMADPAWDEKQNRKDPAVSAESAFSNTHKTEISEIHMNVNAPRMRSPINKTLSDAVGSKEDISTKSFSRMIEENGKNTKKESRDVRNSGGFDIDAENPFKKSDRPTDIAETFSSEDWKKMSEIESGNSILSLLRNSQTPFSSKYVNGEPVVSKTERGKVDKMPPKNSGSRSAEHSPNASSDRSWLEQRTNNSKIEPPELPPRSTASQKPFFHREVPPIPTQSNIKPSVSPAHYRAESFDLDLRTGSNRPNFPAKRSDVSGEDNGNTSNSTIAHTRAHSFTAGYAPSGPYGAPAENRCTSIPEEHAPGAPPADIPPPLPPRNMERKKSSNSNVSGSRPFAGSTEELTKTRSEREKRLSDPRAPEPVRRSSRHADPRGYWGQHQYSKSDSEKHQRVPPSESWHKMSDPSGAIRKSHNKIPDPDEKRKVQEALRKFYHEKTNSQDSGVGSRPNSVSDYGDQYSSMSSIASTRPGSVPADSLGQHHRQSVFSSQTSLSSTSSVYRDSRDSGISSPNPGSWSQHSPPQMANIPSPEYERHHPPVRHSTSSLPESYHSQQHGVRNPPWLSNEIQSSKKSTPVTRSSSMTVKPGLRDDREYTRRSYEGNLGLSRTDSFTAHKSPSRSGSEGSDSSQQDRKRRRSREERRSQAQRREDRLSKEEPSVQRRWSPPKQSPLVVSTSEQSKPPLSEVHAQVQQAERKPISKVDLEDHLLVSDEDDEELVQVEEKILAQKAASQHLLMKKDEPATIFRFPSPPPEPENECTKSASESSLKDSLSLPTPPPSPPSTHHHLAASTLPAELPSLQNLLSSESPPPQKKPLCQTDSFILPPPPSPHIEGSIYIDNDMDFPLPPPPEALLLSQDFSTTKLSPTEGSLPPVPLVEPKQQEPKVLIEERICDKQTSDPIETIPTSHYSRSAAVTTPSLSPQSSIVSSELNDRTSPETRFEPRAPRAWAEDSDIDSDTVDDAIDSVEELDLVITPTNTPRRTEPLSPIYIPDNVSETQHEVRVIERPTELPLLTPSPRRPSQSLSGELSPDGLRHTAVSPTLHNFKDSQGSGDSGISTNPIVDFVLKSLTPCEASDLIDLFPESEREKNSEKKSKMPNAGEETTPRGTPKKADQVDGRPIQTMIPSSLYLQLSPAKALLLTRAKGMQGTGKDEIGEDNAELRKTKEELVTRITRKVEELKSLHKEVQEEITVIEDIGKQVSTKAKKMCKVSEFNRFTMYVEDVERVTKLLLSISRRLAKVESVLNSLDNQDEEQNADLQTMKQNLERKYHDAKMLKKSIDRRHNSILTMLKKYLEEEEHEDFCHFIQMSPRQNIMAQELDDKIQLGEEQLQALTDSLRNIKTSDS